MSLVVDEHREYLSDPVRLNAFREAIRATVRPGDVVLDLASGTGILGLFACAAGASRVYSIEATGMVEIARQVAEANGVADRITFIREVSRHATLPEPVDVIVCDQIGHFGFEAGLVDDAADARRRFLKPGGRIVPQQVLLMAAPVEDAARHAYVAFWQQRPGGFDFSPVREWAANTGYPTTSPAAALLAGARQVVRIDTLVDLPHSVTSRVDLTIQRAGLLHGVAGWFSATLAPGVTLTNAPTATTRVKRRHVFLPVETPVAVQPADLVRLRLYLIPAETILSWTVDVVRGSMVIATSRQSTMKGMLLGRTDVWRTDPRFVPVLTPRGRARLSVLELCDGRRPLAEVEQKLFARHPDLFASPAEAAVFVGEVVSVYAGD